MRFLHIVFALILLISAVSAQNKTIDFAELEKAIEAELKDAKTPGAALAVVSGEKIIFAKGFGTTSAENGNSITPDTLFRIGSTTKMFTAAAVVALAEMGKIQLEAPIGNYVRNLPPKISALTAHQLLSQSSGLRDLAPTFFSNDDAALEQNIRAWKDDIFFTEPNKIYSYSSANYWLAGFLAEEVNGKSYPETIAELILKPLGMNRSTIRPLEAMTFPLALGHDIKNETATIIRPIDNNAAKYPGGSLYSSAQDLARFAMAMLNNGKIDNQQILSPSLVENLQKPQFYLPGKERAFYGYGLLGFAERGVKTISHGGVARGYGSTIFFAPEQKIAIIVLANSNGQTLPKTRQKVMEMLLPLKPEIKEEQKSMTISADEMKRYVGKFAHSPQTWEVFASDEKLFFKEDGKDFELTKTGTDHFAYEQGEILFVPNAKGEIEHIFMGLYAARKVS